MGHVAEKAVNVARMLLLLVLALAVAGFSYTFGYETGAHQRNEQMGRRIEAIYQSAGFAGTDDDAAGGAPPREPDLDAAPRHDCRPERGGGGPPTGSTRDGNRAGGTGSPPPGS